MHKFVGKNQQNHSFQCKKHLHETQFGNFTYEYYLKGELNIFCSFFLELLLYHIHGGHDKLISSKLQFIFKTSHNQNLMFSGTKCLIH